MRNGVATSKSRQSVAPRASMGPSAPSGLQKNTRVSTLGSTSTAGRVSMAPPLKPAGRPASLQKSKDIKSDAASVSSQASGRSDLPSPNESAEAEIPTPTSDQEARAEPVLSPSLSQASAPTQPPAPRRASGSRPRVPSTSQKVAPATAATSRKIEELEAKIRVLEKKRTEDREKLKVLEKAEQDRDKFKGIIQKLETKLQPQQQELTELRRRVKEAESRADTSESQALDIDTAVEMATLDREMAEEKADALQSELNIVKAKIEELELEVEVLREENEEFTKDVDPEERAAHGWIHLEKENERLREALVRLRDVTQDSEDSLKATIQSLEREVDELRANRDSLEETREQLAQSEATVETLREDLETALSAEEMIEELTEKNMSLTERIDGLKTEIEDLENLKELNEEIENAHVETEKQLQDEIDYQEALYLDQVRQTETKDETVKDLEYTVTRFRDLVTTLQTDLQEMRVSQQLTETEASELANRTRAMMDLNMRLQTSASRSQVKAIDLELQKLQIQETTQHFAIVQPFLPDGYGKARESANALLRFKRVGFKANLMHTFIKERLGGVAVPGREDDMFYACEMLGKLTWISGTSERFSIFIESCSIESFKKLEGALYDLEPVERSLNTWIDGLKKETLREKSCSSELDRSIAIMEHLAEIHISESLRDFAKDVYVRARLLQSGFDSAVHIVSHIKAIAQARVLLPVEADEEVEQEAQNFLQRADGLVDQLRSAKVTASKSMQQLDELAARSLTLEESTLSTVEQCQSSVNDLFSACMVAAMATTAVANEEGREDDLTYRDITKAIGSGDSSPFYSLLTKAQAAGKQLQDFYNLTTIIAQTVEFPTGMSKAPWTILAQQVKDEFSAMEQSVIDLGRARGEIAEKNTALVMKDKIVEEMSVTVEVLEKRVGESGGKREKLKELENTISALEANEQRATKRLADVEARLHDAEAEKETLKKQAAVAGTKPGSGPIDEGLRRQILSTNAVLEENVKSLIETVKNLRGSVQSSRALTASTAAQKLTTHITSVPVTPRKPISRRELLGHEASRVCRDAPVPMPQYNILLKESSNALAWRAEREMVGYPLRALDRNVDAWEHLRDDVYDEYRHVAKARKGRGVGKQQVLHRRPMIASPWEGLYDVTPQWALIR